MIAASRKKELDDLYSPLPEWPVTSAGCDPPIDYRTLFESPYSFS